MLARRRKIVRWLSFGERNEELFIPRIIRGCTYFIHKTHAIVAPIKKSSFSLEYSENHFGSLLLSKPLSNANNPTHQQGREQRKGRSVFLSVLIIKLVLVQASVFNNRIERSECVFHSYFFTFFISSSKV